MLKYKLEERGKSLIRIDKWYASSKICSQCGKVKVMPLSERRYECGCGMSMDRDLNAAINIRNKGYEIYRKAA
ncbi:transposase [Hungatella hominis]|uniref:transposase n=1 Tax=Hungatella hominis TaxID=2763050 RepID=UPI001FACA42A|nr:transposase [Hungatella hominis]